MSSKYHAEKAMQEASVALLKVLKRGGNLAVKALFEKLNPDAKIITPQFRYRLENLKRGGYIAGSASGYEITNKGLDRLQSIEFTVITQVGAWDKKWRIIAFDIPETNRAARDAIRGLAKQLGCQQLQLSVWIHPLPCLDKFKDIQKAYGIKEHLKLMEVSWIDNEKQLLDIFHKLYPNL